MPGGNDVAKSEGVDGVRQELLPRSTRAFDQHHRLAERDVGKDVEEPLHPVALADDVVELVAASEPPGSLKPRSWTGDASTLVSSVEPAAPPNRPPAPLAVRKRSRSVFREPSSPPGTLTERRPCLSTPTTSSWHAMREGEMRGRGSCSRSE